MKEKQITEVLDNLINKEITFEEARNKLFILYGITPRLTEQSLFYCQSENEPDGQRCSECCNPEHKGECFFKK